MKTDNQLFREVLNKLIPPKPGKIPKDVWNELCESTALLRLIGKHIRQNNAKLLTCDITREVVEATHKRINNLLLKYGSCPKENIKTRMLDWSKDRKAIRKVRKGRVC